MKSIHFTRFVSVIWMTVIAVAVAALPAAAAPSQAADFGAIDAFVRAQIEDARLPGLAVGVIRGNQVVHVRGFGQADASGRPVTPATPFIIGSVSKSFTALAVMQLVEVGKVDLDASVVMYVPEFRLSDQAASNRITVRQLLNQTSGIPTSAGIAPLTGPVTTLDSQVRHLSSVIAQTAPGATYAYSNSNYEVLGRLVELVSGQSYGDYLKEHITGPLGMVNTFTSAADARAAGLAGGCQLWFGATQCLAPGTGFRQDFVPAGFIVSSAEDLTHYLVAQLNGGAYGTGSVLSADGVAEMHAPAAYAGLSAEGGSYGMGWFAGPRAGVSRTIWHDGSAAASHSMVLMIPDTGWGIVLLTNAESLLYSMLGRIDVIADGIAARLVNAQQPGTLADLYIAFDVLVVLTTALQFRSLIRLIRRPDGVPARKSRNRLVLLEIVVPIWRELFVPLSILIGVPATLGAPWINLVKTDIGVWLLAMACLLMLSGAVRMYRARSAWATLLSHVGRNRLTAIQLAGDLL